MYSTCLVSKLLFCFTCLYFSKTFLLLFFNVGGIYRHTRTVPCRCLKHLWPRSALCFASGMSGPQLQEAGEGEVHLSLQAQAEAQLCHGRGQ